MGVQSTRQITRKRAEELYIEKGLEKQRERLERWAKVCTDEEIENFIEEEFDNYMIVPEGEED